MEGGERMELVLLAQLKLGETASAEFGCWPQAFGASGRENCAEHELRILARAADAFGGTARVGWWKRLRLLMISRTG